MSIRRAACQVSGLALLCVLCAVSARAEDFPPITAAERTLTAVPGAPNAPAVVLARTAELRMLGYGIGSQVSSSLTVYSRTKILTEQGKRYGEVAIYHSRSNRLLNVEARTVLPDGRVLPLPSGAKFERRVSQRDKRYVTSAAFPGVEVGAILDVRYELRFDTFVLLEPWYFSDDLPVLRSEIVYLVPKEIALQGGTVDPFKVGVQTAKETTRFGTKVRIWAENLPPVPAEPFGLPFSDLATRVLILPARFDTGVERIPLLESWAAVSKIVDEYYQQALKKDSGLKDAAQRIVAGAGAQALGRAVALYRFVRDEIATEEDSEGIFPGTDVGVAKTLERHRGGSADKALLLTALLRAVKIDAQPVWAGDRRSGEIDVAIVNPVPFDRVLVAISLDKQRVLVDPADRDLDFGQLAPGYEGTAAVIPDKKSPEAVMLPIAPFDQNARRAVTDLTLDAAGRLAGTGELLLTGQHAWSQIHWKEDAAKTVEAWTEWLGDQFKDFKVADLKVEESVEERRVRVTWSMRQRDDAVLGDEVSLVASLPLGPTHQPFVQAAGTRRSAVLFDYADRDEVELRLHWPEGWKVDARPGPARQDGAVGALDVGVEEPEARALVFHRRLDIKKKELGTTAEFKELQGLFAAIERSDAQPLSLVRR